MYEITLTTIATTLDRFNEIKYIMHEYENFPSPALFLPLSLSLSELKWLRARNGFYGQNQGVDYLLKSSSPYS